MYVFLASHPVSEFTLIESYNKSVGEVIRELGIGKESFPGVIENVLTSINMRDRIHLLVDNVRDSYPEAEGIIIYNDFKKVDVIAFK